MIGATFCSGIGAPEIAAPWVDWQLASEIEPFPRKVLQHRFAYRDARSANVGPRLWGDFTALKPRHFRRMSVPFPDIIVAGTPCQDFSIAGLGKGLKGDRGNLTLQFIRSVHAIQSARSDGRLIVLWENVPGILSDKSNAFGAFLGGMVGAMDALPQPPDGRWAVEGMVEGPRSRAAWAVLDAQWFGLAQRRKRVFVIFDFGNTVDPAAVLFDRDSLRGNSPPRRETGQGLAPTISARTKGGGGLGTEFDCDGGLITQETPSTLTANMHKGINTTMDEGQTMVAHALRGEGFDASEDGTGRGTPLVPVEFGTAGHFGGANEQNVADTIRAKGGDTGPGGETLVAFDCKGTEVQVSTDGSHPTLRSMGHSTSHQNAGGHAAVAFAQNQRDELRTMDVAGALSAEPGMKQQTYLAEPFTIAERGRGEGQNLEYRQDGTSNAVLTPNGGRGGMGVGAIASPWAVRRLLARECERLQGFPDDHTLIPRGRRRVLKDLADEVAYLRLTYPDITDDVAIMLAADGPRYKALGNSMPVPVLAWILDRIRISWEIHESLRTS